MVENFTVDDTMRNTTVVQIQNSPASRATDVSKELIGPSDCVRGEEDVIELHEGRRSYYWLNGKAIEGGTGDAMI